MTSQQVASPRVSVVVPTHNNARYIGCALDSVLAQDYADFELLVVDDASHDDTPDIVAGYTARDARIHYLRNETQRGIAGSRNRGLDAARGEFMACLDGDDWAHPRRLSHQVAFLDRRPDHAAVGSWATWMDDRGQPLRGMTRRPTDPDEAAAQLIYKSSLQQPSVTARTAVMRTFRYDENFIFSSDYELWSRMAASHKLASQPLPLVCCRRHAASTTRGDGHQQRIFAAQHTIFARQLDRLGVGYDDRDLERHRLLWRSTKRDMAAPREELQWAEQWLARLAEANRCQRCYPHDAFLAVLGWGWCQLSYNVLTRAPHRALGQFRAGSLRWLGPWLRRQLRPAQLVMWQRARRDSLARK